MTEDLGPAAFEVDGIPDGPCYPRKKSPLFASRGRGCISLGRAMLVVSGTGRGDSNRDVAGLTPSAPVHREPHDAMCALRPGHHPKALSSIGIRPQAGLRKCNVMERMTMPKPIKSFRDLATALRGSAFRRACYDGRTMMLRAIPTWGSRRRAIPRPVPPSGLISPRRRSDDRRVP